MSFVKETLRNVPTVFLAILTSAIMLLITIGRLFSSFVELCCVIILMIIAVSYFALLFLLPIIFPNLGDRRYRVNYLIVYTMSFLTSWFSAIYSPSVQSFLMHLLSSLALLIFILTSSLLPVMECYKKYTLSWRDLLIGLKLVRRASERTVNYILGKLTLYSISLMPASIIISYLLTEAHLINIQQIPFNTLVYLILNIIVIISVFMETFREFPKLFPGISKMLGRGFYYILALITLIISATYLYELFTSYNQKFLEYSPSTFYGAITLLSFLFFFMAMVTPTMCRDEATAST